MNRVVKATDFSVMTLRRRSGYLIDARSVFTSDDIVFYGPYNTLKEVNASVRGLVRFCRLEGIRVCVSSKQRGEK